jgi:hypothetical protein
MPGLYQHPPNETNAYHCDGTHEYFGFAAKGTLTTHSHWQIFKIEYNTSYATAGDPWIIKWPNGSDQPIFKWVDVATLSYRILGC